jgi:integrase
VFQSFCVVAVRKETEIMVKRPRGTGAIYNVTSSKIFRVGYTDASGKYIRESSGTANKTEAQKFLRKRMEAVSAGNFLGPRIEKVTVDELYADLLADYRDNGHAVAWAESVWDLHLKPFFGGMRASRVGTTQLGGYVEKRKGEGAARSTINRELALLRRAFSIGCNEAEPQKVAKVPRFGRFIVSEEGNERKGFVEESQYRKLADAAGGQLWLRTLLALAYTFGFRRGELLGNPKRGTEGMRCKQVDLLNNTVSLYSGETKNGEGRTVALTEECRKLVTELRRGKQPEDFLFTRANGEVVLDFRATWDSLTAAAGVPGLLFHDLRRSAVRNMVRRGVPQKTAREISGHKTDAVFSRYNIVSGADIADAARKIEEGAKAALQGSIHSSFTVEPQSEPASEQEVARKPS